MISPSLVAEIQRLLSERRFSHRTIGQMVGVSRNTVGAVALGRHRNIGVPQNSAEEDAPAGPPRRCPTCGGLVYMPCRLCRARDEATRNPHPTCNDGDSPDDSTATTLLLRPEHEVRYQRVRARRMRMLAAGLV